jgi:phosphoribosylaminoimidazole-succinocarboxamide synthase
MLCRRLDMVQVECVARGYLTGSGLADYRATGGVVGQPLPPGLEDGSRLPEPLFTPATKAAVGEHDENVPYEAVEQAVGAELAAELRRLTLAVYARGAVLAAERGLLLADTKLELGHDRAGVLTLGDEVLTPDSSRYWPADAWRPGRPQPSFDKQYVRDWLDASGWDRTAPGPELPEEVVARTRDKYVEAYERLTGSSFDSWLRED